MISIHPSTRLWDSAVPTVSGVRAAGAHAHRGGQIPPLHGFHPLGVHRDHVSQGVLTRRVEAQLIVFDRRRSAIHFGPTRFPHAIEQFGPAVIHGPGRILIGPGRRRYGQRCCLLLRYHTWLVDALRRWLFAHFALRSLVRRGGRRRRRRGLHWAVIAGGGLDRCRGDAVSCGERCAAVRGQASPSRSLRDSSSASRARRARSISSSSRRMRSCPSRRACSSASPHSSVSRRSRSVARRARSCAASRPGRRLSDSSSCNASPRRARTSSGSICHSSGDMSARRRTTTRRSFSWSIQWNSGSPERTMRGACSSR